MVETPPELRLTTTLVAAGLPSSSTYPEVKLLCIRRGILRLRTYASKRKYTFVVLNSNMGVILTIGQIR